MTMAELKPGLYWVRTEDMWSDDELIPAELEDDGKVWVLGYDQPLGLEDITEWGPTLMRPEQIWAFKTRVNQLQPGVKVHILHHGLPLCKFTAEAPGKWDQHHMWTPVTETQHATCGTCLEEWDGMK
jgi:hypothetical protein